MSPYCIILVIQYYDSLLHYTSSSVLSVPVGVVIYEHLNILAMFCYNLHPAKLEEVWPPLIAWFLFRFLPRFWPF